MIHGDRNETVDTFLPKPSSGLTQEYLMAVTQYRDIVEFPYRISDEKVKYLNNYSVIVHMKRLNGDKYSQDKYDGRLIAICDSGIFLYKHRKHKVRYYPYRVIWVLSKGLTNSKVVWNFALGGAAVGTVVGPLLTLDVASGVVGGFFMGAFYGGTSSVYYILGKSLFRSRHGDKYCRVFAKTENGIAFRERCLKKSPYIRYVDINTFPAGDSSGLPRLTSRFALEKEIGSQASTPVTIVKVIDTQDLGVNNQNIGRVDSADLPGRKVDKTEVTTPSMNPGSNEAVVAENQPKNSQNNWGELRSVKGYYSTWMYTGFQATEVRTAYLSNQFSWIRQRPITPSDLKKIKSKSEIQFLAMWVTTAAGYSFREVVSFNKEQLAFMQPKEPYLAESIAPNSLVDPIVLLDLDMENLQVLYNELIK